MVKNAVLNFSGGEKINEDGVIGETKETTVEIVITPWRSIIDDRSGQPIDYYPVVTVISPEGMKATGATISPDTGNVVITYDAAE